MPKYNYYVSGTHTGLRDVKYNGEQAADAMAAWSAAITDGYEYVVIEALREEERP